MVIYFAISIEINTFAHVKGRVQEDGMCIEGTIGVSERHGRWNIHGTLIILSCQYQRPDRSWLMWQDSCLPATDSKTPL